MNERVEVVPASIEHLDFTPTCEMESCGVRPATYTAIASCCAGTFNICSACVTRKASMGLQTWRCGRCGERLVSCAWLDIHTLHPLGGAS